MSKKLENSKRIFQRLVNQKKKEDGELVFSRNGHIFRVKAVDLDKIY